MTPKIKHCHRNWERHLGFRSLPKKTATQNVLLALISIFFLTLVAREPDLSGNRDILESEKRTGIRLVIYPPVSKHGLFSVSLTVSTLER